MTVKVAGLWELGQSAPIYIRDCGNCTWCCYFMTAPELNKAVNEYCKYCIVGEGCSIYENRPKACKNFGCLWFHQNQIPESLRPDRCGVMFELPDNCQTYIGYSNPTKPESWRNPAVLVLIRKINEAGHSVLIYGKEKKYFLAKEMTIEAVKSDLSQSLFMHKIEGRI